MNQQLAEKIAGEITLGDTPGLTIRKWRDIFHISQCDLAAALQISPSVVCDYEGGRRKSPGIGVVKRIVESLIEIDKSRGGKILEQYLVKEPGEGIIEIREFPIGIPVSSFIDAIEAEVLMDGLKVDRNLYGYTLIDSLKAIVSYSSVDYLKLYGWSSERALIFTGIEYGRSPMIAIRAHPLTPVMVVYHQPKKTDKLSLKLAELEMVSLVKTDIPMTELTKKLNSL